MRITVTIDSATAEDLWDAQCAFQRTAGIPLPQQLQTESHVRIAGSAFTWISPPMYPERHVAWQREFMTLVTERAQRESEAIVS